MKTLLCGSVALILFAVSATAQNTNEPIQPNELTATANQPELTIQICAGMTGAITATTMILTPTATARTLMATAIRHTATPTHIDARTTGMRIRIDAHILDIRTGVTCTGITDTKSGRARPSDKNKAPDISGASNLSRQCRFWPLADIASGIAHVCF